MTTFYLDFVGGSDAADGLTFANRWKTINSGATSARTAAGDAIRIMGSGVPTSLGVTGAFTNDGRDVTLSSALTANIATCDTTAWTASANVTATASTTRLEGSHAASIAIAAAFTTGLAAYFPTGTLNLSGYEQVSFAVRTSAAVGAGVLSLRLCSDAAGVTTVDNLPLPAMASGLNTYWFTMTLDKGAALGSAIQSVALYCDIDPGTLTIFIDNIVACKAKSAADSLTHNSLIGKVWGLNWAAATSYASNDIRKPTTPNRNGFAYKVTAGGGGSSGGSEPTWPVEIGATVTDGALTWTCFDLEETWYGIKSINGTTVTIQNAQNSLQGSGRGYSGDTETVALYKRQPISMPGANNVTNFTTQKSGTWGNQISYSGGWNTTDMSTQNDETWLDGHISLGVCLVSTVNYVSFESLGFVRYDYGFRPGGVSNYIKNINAGHCNSYALDFDSGSLHGYAVGLHSVNNAAASVALQGGRLFPVYRCNFSGNTNDGIRMSVGASGTEPMVTEARIYNNNIAFFGASTRTPSYFVNVKTRSNQGAPFQTTAGSLYGLNCVIEEATPVSIGGIYTGDYAYFTRWGQVADAHRIYSGSNLVVQSATDQRNTASGIAWKFTSPAAGGHAEATPIALSLAKVAVKAGALVTITVWTRRDHADIKGKLFVRGAQLPGVPSDLSVACEPTINTWTQSGSITFTPSAAGVVEVQFFAWNDNTVSRAFWVDDIEVLQA
jgi:hypothetical protein